MTKLFSLLSFTLLLATAANAASTLEAIKAAGSLSCGINTEEPEYSTEDAHGNHGAFDQELCKAVAVAALGPNAKFVLHPFRDERDALKALQSGEVALLATASPNYLHTTNEGYGFSRPLLYDYQGFLVNKTMGIRSPKDLNGKKLCFLGGTEIELEMQGYAQREKIHWLPFSFQEEGEMEAAFITNNCAAITADVTQLAYARIAFKSMARDYEILPDVIAKDPLAIAYRQNDPQWAAIINWTVEALIQAEESGITQANLVQVKKSMDPIQPDPVVGRLLGVPHGYGQSLGLRDNWAADVIEAVGNYGEIFERALGVNSKMKLARGPNRLWNDGGLMYALPIR